MIKKWAEVRATKLHLLDGDSIKLDSKRWFDWLEVNHVFLYVLNDSVTLTARKEQLDAGKFQWCLHHQIDDKRLKTNLAKSANLTSKLLLAKATEMIFNQTEMFFAEQTPDFPPQIAPTIEAIRQQVDQDLRRLETNYKLAIEQVTTQANLADLSVNSEAIIRRIVTEVDHKEILNIDNLAANE